MTPSTSRCPRLASATTRGNVETDCNVEGPARRARTPPAGRRGPARRDAALGARPCPPALPARALERRRRSWPAYGSSRDPRHRWEERRLQLHQVGHDLLRVLLPVGERGANIEHQELNDQRERVRQRQEQVDAVVLTHQVLRLQCRRDRTVVAVRQLARLGRPGRPRRVEEQAPGLRRDA
jgi:hypothetical protein